MCAVCSINNDIQNQGKDSISREMTGAQGPLRILGGLWGWHGGRGRRAPSLGSKGSPWSQNGLGVWLWSSFGKTVRSHCPLTWAHKGPQEGEPLGVLSQASLPWHNLEAEALTQPYLRGLEEFLEGLGLSYWLWGGLESSSTPPSSSCHKHVPFWKAELLT